MYCQQITLLDPLTSWFLIMTWRNPMALSFQENVSPKMVEVLNIKQWIIPFHLPLGFMLASKHLASLQEGHQFLRALSIWQWPRPAATTVRRGRTTNYRGPWYHLLLQCNRWQNRNTLKKKQELSLVATSQINLSSFSDYFFFCCWHVFRDH